MFPYSYGNSRESLGELEIAAENVFYLVFILVCFIFNLTLTDVYFEIR